MQLTTPTEQLRFADPDYELEDRYRKKSGRVYLSGSQALVRLPIMQRQRDEAAGLNTAGHCTGYRGSPIRRSKPRRPISIRTTSSSAPA